MIFNIIDNRKRKYRWKKIDAVAEPCWHDNTCKDTDRAEKHKGEGLGYDDRERISLHDATKWAAGKKYPVTLYLYDAGALKVQFTIGQPSTKPNPTRGRAKERTT